MGKETKINKNEEELVQVIKLNSLEHATEKAIRDSFLPFYEQAAEWKEKALALVVKDINETDLMQQAREARLILQKIRTSADKKRKELKEDSLNYGRAVQGVYNFIEDLIKPIEKHLQEQEDFVIIEEEKIRTKLHADRTEELKPYAEFVPFGLDLGNLTEDDYQKMLKGAKLQQKDKEETLAREKAEREERERLEAEQREAQRIENERLKKEAEEKAALRAKRNEELRPYIIFIRDYNAMLEMEEKAYSSALAEIIVGAKQHWDHEAKVAREKAVQERLRNEQLEKERLAREKAERELQEKKAAEEKAAADKLAAEEAEAAKGEAEKFADLIAQITALKTKYTFKSKKYKGLQNAVNTLLDKIIDYATKK